MLTAKPLATDFGKEVFPRNYKTKKVRAHLFDGYWEDLGTIKSYHEASLALAEHEPAVRLLQPRGRHLHADAEPAGQPRSTGPTLEHSLVADGCVIGTGSRIERSLIGVRSRIGADCVIRDTVHHRLGQLRDGGAESARTPERPART